MVAPAASQPKSPVNIILPQHTTSNSVDGIVAKRLLCSTIRELGLKFERNNSPTLDWVAELVVWRLLYTAAPTLRFEAHHCSSHERVYRVGGWDTKTFHRP